MYTATAPEPPSKQQLPAWVWIVIISTFLGLLVGVLLGFCIARRIFTRKGLLKHRYYVDLDTEAIGHDQHHRRKRHSSPALLSRSDSISKDPFDDDVFVNTPSSPPPSTHSPTARTPLEAMDPSAPPAEKLMPATILRAMIHHARMVRTVPLRANSVRSQRSFVNLPTYTEATGLSSTNPRKNSSMGSSASSSTTLLRSCESKVKAEEKEGVEKEFLQEVQAEVRVQEEAEACAPSGVGVMPPVPASAPDDWVLFASSAWEFDENSL